MKTGNDYVLSIIDDLKSKYQAAQQKWVEYDEELKKLEKKMAATQVVAERTELWMEMDSLKKLQEEPLAEAAAYRHILNKLKYI